jgi:Protein of unknown function (DUF3616)
MKVLPIAGSWAAGLVLALIAAGTSCGDGGWQLQNAGAMLKVKGKIESGKDVSAAAKVGATIAWIGSDETRSIQPLRLDLENHRFEALDPIALLEGDGSEIDIEGMAFSRGNRTCYITGSHSLSRKKQRSEADRSWVFALPVDADGRADTRRLKKASLRLLLKADSKLAPFLGKPATENGVDIEGLAERGGRLFFGLRAPSLDGKAFVIVVDAEALFADARPSCQRLALPLGAGRGIREMVSIEDGFLIIVGASTSDDESTQAPAAGAFGLYFWGGTGGPLTKIGDISNPPGKPEGLLVLSETSTVVEVVVFHDGAKDGGPTPLHILKPSAR